jgi:hypothetical protein
MYMNIIRSIITPSGKMQYADLPSYYPPVGPMVYQTYDINTEDLKNGIIIPTPYASPYASPVVSILLI